MLLFASQNTSPTQPSEKSQEATKASTNPDEYKNLYEAQAKYLASILDVYFLTDGEYPLDIPYMIETIKMYPKDFPSIKKDDFKQIKKATELPEFKYKVRGDNQAYKFTYKGVEGETVTKKGDYQNDYR